MALKREGSPGIGEWPGSSDCPGSDRSSVGGELPCGNLPGGKSPYNCGSVGSGDSPVYWSQLGEAVGGWDSRTDVAAAELLCWQGWSPSLVVLECFFFFDFLHCLGTGSKDDGGGELPVTAWVTRGADCDRWCRITRCCRGSWNKA